MVTRIKVFHLRQSTEIIGGAEVVIQRVVSLMDKDRFDISIACLRKGHMDLGAIRRSLADSGVVFSEIVDNRLVDLRALFKLRKLIRQSGAQILHCHDPKTDLYGRLLKLLIPSIKLVSTLHGWVVNSKRGQRYKRLDMRTVRGFHRVIAVSPAILDEAQANGIEQIVLVRNGISVGEFRERVLAAGPPPIAKSEGEQWVGFVGRLTAEKGPLDFVHVAKRVLAQYQNARFVMIGEGQLQEACEKLANGFGLEDRLLFLGQVAFDQMPSIFANLDILLSTSATEGLPNVLLEGAAAGIPIVATDVGGCSEVVKPGMNGYLEAYGDHDALAARVLELLRDDELARTCAHYGMALVERELSMEKTVASIEALYEELVGYS